MVCTESYDVFLVACTQTITRVESQKSTFQDSDESKVQRNGQYWTHVIQMCV